MQQWRFVLVDDASLKARLAPLYRTALTDLWRTVYAQRLGRAHAEPDDPASRRLLAMQRSAQHLADHFEEVPLLLLAFVRFDDTGGSIFPAVWNAMLAARAHGVGSALTTVLNRHTAEVRSLLVAPDDDRWEMVCCVAFGYPRGRWA